MPSAGQAHLRMNERHDVGTAPAGPFDKLPCNAFAWCGAEVCFEPDAHHHTLHDCWLKFTEAPAAPEINMRGRLPDWYRKKHPDSPEEVQWVSGVLLPPSVATTPPDTPGSCKSSRMRNGGGFAKWNSRSFRLRLW